MMTNRNSRCAVLALAFFCASLAVTIPGADAANKKKKKKKKPTPVYASVDDPKLPAGFRFQGEYTGTLGGRKAGCRVVDLGKGAFHAVIYFGGLPGDGWDGEHRALMDGTLDGEKVTFVPADGKRTYLAGPPDRFSATKRFPPEGHVKCTAVIAGDTMTGKTDAGAAIACKKTRRTSPTMGKKPPAGAIVLFDGTNTDAFRGGRLDTETKRLNTDGKDIRTKQKFNDYVMHLEFMLPYRPQARGQGRANSGCYQVEMYEVQILDSFGLEGVNNECGGIYKKADPKVNMCYPPLTWQTFDVTFTNAKVKDGKKVRNAVITLRHNGVVIHDHFEIDGKTGGARKEPEGTPGPIKLQGHGNPLQFRNIWILEK